MDTAGRAGDFETAAAIQKELESLKELIFSEPIVEAVARIKIILAHEGLIDTAHYPPAATRCERSREKDNCSTAIKRSKKKTTGRRTISPRPGEAGRLVKRYPSGN